MQSEAQLASDEEAQDTSDEEESLISPQFIQITAPYKEVNCWISSFIEENRKQINLHNVQDFCVASELRQNCARIDAVLVKRKGTTSHITVKDIKNYCGPQEQVENHTAISDHIQKMLLNKKVFSFNEVEQRIKNLNAQYNPVCQTSSSSSSSNYTGQQYSPNKSDH